MSSWRSLTYRACASERASSAQITHSYVYPAVRAVVTILIQLLISIASSVVQPQQNMRN